MKADAWLIFFLLLILILTVYWIGTVSDVLVFAKTVQQLGYFLSGRTPAGNFANASS